MALQGCLVLLSLLLVIRSGAANHLELRYGTCFEKIVHNGGITAAYLGTVNITASGLPCQRWDSQVPHAHTSSAASVAYLTNWASAHNYCRDVGYNLQPWCYTTNPAVQRENCAIPDCSQTTTKPPTTSTYPLDKQAVVDMEILPKISGTLLACLAIILLLLLCYATCASPFPNKAKRITVDARRHGTSPNHINLRTMY